MVYSDCCLYSIILLYLLVMIRLAPSVLESSSAPSSVTFPSKFSNRALAFPPTILVESLTLLKNKILLDLEFIAAGFGFGNFLSIAYPSQYFTNQPE